MTSGSVFGACDACLRRTWLLARLSAHLDRARGGVAELLEREDEDLIEAVGGKDKMFLSLEWGRFDAVAAQARREEATAAGLTIMCRCASAYPRQLLDLIAPPHVLHVLGNPEAVLTLDSEAAVAVVGTRRPSAYGRGAAHAIGHGLAASGLTVVSGMANGIDSAAHEGALTAPIVQTPPGRAPTVAVLAGSAHLPYPVGKRRLHQQIGVGGAVISELGPGAAARRWAFLARNRIIAALAGGTVVVEAAEYSGAMVTARLAQQLERRLGAVPGQITSELATGPHALVAEGATLVRGPQDVLDMLFGSGRRTAATDTRPAPTLVQRRVLALVAEGHDSLAALARLEVPDADAFVTVAELELSGWLRRGPGGRLVPVP